MRSTKRRVRTVSRSATEFSALVIMPLLGMVYDSRLCSLHLQSPHAEVLSLIIGPYLHSHLRRIMAWSLVVMLSEFPVRSSDFRILQSSNSDHLLNFSLGKHYPLASQSNLPLFIPLQIVIFLKMSNSTTAHDNTYVLYHYSPSIAVAGVASGLVAIATGLHCGQMWKSRAWFLTPLLIGGLCKASQHLIACTILIVCS